MRCALCAAAAKSKGSYDMLRSIAILLAAITLTSICAASDHAREPSAAASNLELFALDSPARSPEFLTSLGLTPPTSAIAQQACCKICSTGKACGNTCISRDKECHVGPGCACNG